jgi:predicted MFS family arabinose efflux permease
MPLMFPQDNPWCMTWWTIKEHVSNAIALNSSMVHLTRLIGPALSGIVLEKLGAQVCFSINAVSFLASSLSCCL